MSSRPLLTYPVLLFLGQAAWAQVPDSTQRQAIPRSAIEAITPVGSPEELRQYEDPSTGPFLVEPARQRAILTLDASGMYDSNALRNELVVGLFRGETLDRELRTRTQDELKGRNRFGSEVNVRLSYCWGGSFLGRTHWRPLISMAYHDVTGMRFTDAVYQLTFFGNARFEGDAAILAPSAVEQQRYQTLGFGIKHATRETFLRLDLVNGQYLNAVRLDRGYLYTAQDGTSLEADVDGSWYTSDTAGQQFGKSNGLGLSISGALELRSNTMRYSLRVEDLGFIAWNSNAQQLLQNDVISYDGLHVEDILDLSGSVLGDNWISDTLGLNTTSGGFLRPLPARFQIGVSPHRRNGNVVPRRRPDLFQLEQLAIPGYVPHLTWTPSLPLSRNWLVFGKAGYGGFGGFRAGIGFWGTTDWGLVKLEVPNVVGTLSGSAKGKAATIGLELAF
jgi:hypothetical protein